MRIECRITGLDPKPHLIDWFQGTLEEAAKRIDFNTASIGRVIIAEPDRFGEAVDVLRSGATHTDTEAGVAGGKTFSRIENGRVVTDIAFQQALFEKVAAALESGTWDVDQQEALYVICHEFGHAKDHALRIDASEIADPTKSTFAVQPVAAYYSHIVLTEYAACRNAASQVSEALFQHQLIFMQKWVTSSYRVVNHHLDNRGQITHNQLMHLVCQGAWLMMSELAKQYGHSIGKPDRQAVMRDLEKGLFDADRLADEVELIGSSYPAWDMPALAINLTPIWRKYVEFSGVKFVDGPDGDTMEDSP